ncbi:hypothetical protein ACMV5I_02305 [Serratia sp. T13T92]|uniref:hypothetical protein n=1 Tax=Serratia sp. T13T92 TaxID=3397496 RepID=UPI0039DF420C
MATNSELNKWISPDKQLPEKKEQPYQVLVACRKTLGGVYEGQPVRRFIQDWVVRQWPQNFIAWQYDPVGLPSEAHHEE